MRRLSKPSQRATACRLSGTAATTAATTTSTAAAATAATAPPSRRGAAGAGVDRRQHVVDQLVGARGTCSAAPSAARRCSRSSRSVTIDTSAASASAAPGSAPAPCATSRCRSARRAWPPSPARTARRRSGTPAPPGRARRARPSSVEQRPRLVVAGDALADGVGRRAAPAAARRSAPPARAGGRSPRTALRGVVGDDPQQPRAHGRLAPLAAAATGAPSRTRPARCPSPPRSSRRCWRRAAAPRVWCRRTSSPYASASPARARRTSAVVVVHAGAQSVGACSRAQQPVARPTPRGPERSRSGPCQPPHRDRVASASPTLLAIGTWWRLRRR